MQPPQAPALGLVWPKVFNSPIQPAGKPHWPTYLPAIDADGNDLPGIRLPAVAVPSGTYLGWNLRKPGYGDGDICLLSGTYLPFARDTASRGGDSRASLAERYRLASDREAKVRTTAAQLQAERFLLPEDAGKLVAAEAGQ